ncbi:hypothetical protein Plec18167_008652 [Paecilomyces lecythidis]|uniref:Endoplasmic reticulum junction formation protein lunapark n=1 Tax=Paecilomyces lecythidis TaxID=3004212 RepID=A0ABR3WUN9_9EURO
MVSFWPWKGEDNSPASFEKTLSTLSTKITETTNRLDVSRQRSRRFKALWTLYTTFAYLLYSIILALVLGYQNWGAVEYAAVAGGPIVIYAVRAVASKFFEYQISKTQRHLDSLNAQRESTIEKLKVATKYNSTQQLLEKYGGESPKPTPPKGGERPKQREQGNRQETPQQGGRTGLPPPPTANIRRPQEQPQLPATPVRSPQNGGPSPPPASFPAMQNIPRPPPSVDEPGFAPNAFPAPAQYHENPRWYDRLMDVLLGEDETLPKNRLALICSNCRLVNGQAPPGVKSLEEIGKWRCGGCGAWNGEESEAKKMIANMRRQSQSADVAWEPVSKGEEDLSSNGEVTDEGVIVAASEGSRASDVEQEHDGEDEQHSEEEQMRTRSKRGRPKRSAAAA